MGGAGLHLLIGTAVAAALIHTLIPDHWIPFVLVGRARGWPVRRVALYSGASAVVHVLLSLALGWMAVAVGAEAALHLGERMEQVGSWVLILFGLVYAAWAWRKGGHFHPGGARVHPEPAAADHDCEGLPEHLHYHQDAAVLADTSVWTGWLLALVVGLNPCVLILPVLYKAATEGPAALAWVSVSYAATTTALVVGLSALGVAGSWSLRLPWPARYMEAASGVLIALLGVVFLLLGE